ncbi:MAG: dTDP-glucose 4,6-dehydratase [Candidatus Scalindua rubra]|uniref:dTDP-glucose 4,6-dehydratase n=1 Tax=Candidatus Scalindua rubra TaxID=1872076 RepID=A0A1E3X6C2_9BACT|nr:MAG: dTDP-glucose 4,6-dehydratase [Candidatus Scalindua rubra]
MVVPTFVKQALLNSPISVYGDGKQSRCFLHVEDAVNAVTKLANDPDAVGEIFNVGSDKEIKIEELAKLVKEITGSNSEIVYIPYNQAYEEGFEDMQRRTRTFLRSGRLLTMNQLQIYSRFLRP